MKNIYLFQPQDDIEYNGQKTFWLPYSVGTIWSYAQQFDHIKNNFECKELFFRKEDPEVILARLDNPKLCGFSNYIWNRNYNLYVAEQIKKRWPDCVIIFGGPDVDSYVSKFTFIDTIILNEGEQSFAQLLTDIAENKEVELMYQAERLTDLNVPSPYTTGVFDNIIAQHTDAVWLMVLETNRGCPFQCTFCDWGSAIHQKVKKFPMEKIEAELQWMSKNPIDYIYCADANFGIFKERDFEIATLVHKYGKLGILKAFRTNYAKNSNELIFKIAKTLGEFARGVTLSVQSMHDKTLKAIKRENLASNDLNELLTLSKEYNVTTYTEVILGLPEETLDSFKQGLCEILEFGQHNSIDIFFAQVLRNSELGQPESIKKYGIKTVVLKDYWTTTNSWMGVIEDTLTVQSTNTMTLEDLAEAWVYGWMIMNFHCYGYTQVFARYCRTQKNVSYREFYDALYHRLNTGTGEIPDFIERYTELVINYVRTGFVIDPHNLARRDENGIVLDKMPELGLELLYKNKDWAYQTAQEVAKQFTPVHSSIADLQKNIFFDINTRYPISIDTVVDLETWNENPCKYQVESNAIDIENFNFWRHRRDPQLRNNFTKVEQ